MSVALAKVESWDDHVEAWHALGRQVDGAAWDRAAIAVSLKGKYGEAAVPKFAKDVGFSDASVYAYASTFEAFPQKSDRSETLTFTHHLQAVVRTANVAAARAALALADEKKWSTYALLRHLRPPVEAEETAEGCDTEEGACGPITPRDRMLHIALLMKGFNKIRDYDPAPLAQLGTKKSLKELSVQIDGVIGWLESFKTTINRRL